MGDLELGYCECCGKLNVLIRTYFTYNIKCECHSPHHFELVSHCYKCIPKEPEITEISIGSTKILVETYKLKTISEKIDIKDYIRSLKLQKVINKNIKHYDNMV